jgi:hypothetical protein
MRIGFDIRACIIADLSLCTFLNVKDVTVLPTDAYPHVLTSSLNLDPMLANTVSTSFDLDRPIKAKISRRTCSCRYLYTPDTRNPLQRKLKVAPHQKSQEWSPSHSLRRHTLAHPSSQRLLYGDGCMVASTLVAKLHRPHAWISIRRSDPVKT